MTIRNIQNFVDAENNGQTFFSTFRKTPNVATGAGVWFDLSMSPGNPQPNNWPGIPYTAAPLTYSTTGGIPHGGNVPGSTKLLKTLGLLTITAAAVPLPMIMCDYLLCYADIDMSITPGFFQNMTNTQTLTRNITGAGVQIMAIEVASQSGAGNPQFQVQYTNSAGVTGRVTPPIACGTQVVPGTLINTAAATARTAGPFLPLQSPDSGVRKIEAIKFLQQDFGLITLVLVDPLENTIIRTVDAAVERNCFLDFSDMPIISDDAFLGLICCPSGSLSGAPIHGYIQTVWG